MRWLRRHGCFVVILHHFTNRTPRRYDSPVLHLSTRPSLIQSSIQFEKIKSTSHAGGLVPIFRITKNGQGLLFVIVLDVVLDAAQMKVTTCHTLKQVKRNSTNNQAPLSSSIFNALLGGMLLFAHCIAL